MPKLLWFVVAFLLACGGKKDKTEPKPDDKPDKPTTEPAKKSPADLFAGPKVTLPPQVAKLRLEMPEAEAKAAVPELFAQKYGGLKPETYEGVEITGSIQGGRLYQIFVEIKQPIETVKGWLVKVWGEPRATKNSIGNPEFWFDSPDVGLRAKLETSASNSMLRYYRVMSKEQLLGSDPKTFGFEKGALIGTTQDDVMKNYADYKPKVRDNDPDSITMSLPALTTSEHANNLDVRLKGGKVTGFTLSVTTGGDAATDAAFAARLEQLFGKGKADSTGLYTDYPGPPKVKAEIRKDSASFGHAVWVGDTDKK